MMKVQSQPAVSQNAAAAGTTTAAKTADAKPAAATAAAGAAGANLDAGKLTDRFRDGFDTGRAPIRDWPPYGPLPLPPKDTMSLQDHLTAGQLSDKLSNPLDKPLLDSGKKDQQLTRDEKGVMRGPDGQPLAKVQLKDGNTAYVDPNTNQYYLTDEKENGGFFGNRSVNALGPLPLPEGAKFSNSYFSDGDVRSIERDARGGGWHFPIDPLPLPRPIPFPDPIPFPRPIPIDPPWGPMRRIDPGVLLDATAAKTNGIE